MRIADRDQKGEPPGRNGYLLLDFPDECFGEGLMLLDVPAWKTPEAGIGAAVRAPTSEKHHSVPHE
jgi:hypothetical protein